jgi:predicted ATP-grasp superfamily ATP-dependent carboligase
METSTRLRSISVLIPDGETWDAVKILRCLNSTPGIATHILSRTHLPLARFSRHCAGYHYHGGYNEEDWIHAIKSLVLKLHIGVVLPVTEKGVELMVRNRTVISEIAALPSLPGLESLKTVQDKWSLYCFAKKRGFPVVPSVLVSNNGEIIPDPHVLDTFKYPAILKPTSLGGGQGIVKVNGRDDLCRAWEDKRIIKGCKYMLQSYIPGVDLCLGVFCKGGEILAYTLQRSLSSPDNYFGPQRTMRFVNDEKILDIGKRFVSVLGWDGIAFIDVRIDERDQTAKIIEVNPRYGQAILGCLVAGINFPLIACLDAMHLGHPHKEYKTVGYTHPKPTLKILMSRLIKRKMSPSFRWQESGLRFAFSDPLPEAVDVIRGTMRQLQRWITSKR